MHTVEMLEQTLHFVERLGYQIREEWLAGNGGGGCEVNGQKVFFLDLAQDPGDQLELALDTLRRERETADLPLPRELHDLVAMRKGA